MNKPEFITFTGVDRETNIDRMVELSARYPIEWGVLFSPDRQGKPDQKRYPDLTWIAYMLLADVTFAAHICGGHARAIVETGDCPELHEILSSGRFERFQINTADPSVSPLVVSEFALARKPGIGRAILQCRGPFPDDASCDWLYDCSGGNGRLPGTWPAPISTAATIGYAGGINPENVVEVLTAIAAVNPGGQPFAIDMESGVRDGDDLFDLDKVEAVCKAVYGEICGKVRRHGSTIMLSYLQALIDLEDAGGVDVDGLGKAAETHMSEMLQALTAAEEENAYLRKRLEIQPAGDVNGKIVPFDTRQPDGISTRNGTIAILDAQVASLHAKVDAAQV